MEIESFLKEYLDDGFVYITNPGNGGDNLIGCAALQLFNKMKFKYYFSHHMNVFDNKTLVYAGGANFVPMYHDFKRFLKNNEHRNRILLLPHTIYGCEELISRLTTNVTIVCRDRVSFDHVYTHIPNKEYVKLAHDMAFNLNLNKLEIPKMIGNGTLNAFRTDIERNPNIQIPDDNIDVSRKFEKGTHSIELLYDITREFLTFLNNYEVINTNRLHVAIGGALLGKTVYFYNNSYFKCKAIYDFSMKDKYRNVKYIDK